MKNKNLLLSFVLFFLITGFTPQISGMEENKRQLDADHLRKLLVNQEQYQLGMLNYRLENSGGKDFLSFAQFAQAAEAAAGAAVAEAVLEAAKSTLRWRRLLKNS